MINAPYALLFSSFMMMGTLMALSSPNWILVWAGSELNALSFIPLVLFSKSLQETEGAIKYFLAQALGSATMLMTSLIMWHSHSPLVMLILTLAMMLKLGGAPCHFWFPQMMACISWFNCFLLCTWQKLGPLVLLSTLLPNSYIINLVVITNAFVGGLLGLNQSKLRPLLAYSSITHISWMLSPITIHSPHLSTLYFLMYCLIAAPIFFSLAILPSKGPDQLNKSSPANLMLLSLLLLSLAGMPPLSGFIPKWIMVYYIGLSNQIMLISMLIGSLMNLFFYMTLMFSLLSKKSLSTVKPAQSPLLLTSSSSLLGLFLLLYAMAFLNKS